MFDPRIVLCILLFLYQSFLDIFKDELQQLYILIQNTTMPFLADFQIAKWPALFLVFFILHRAFIHGLIVKIFTRQQKMLHYYIILDLAIFCMAVPIFLVRRIFSESQYLTEPLTFAFVKLLNTPILLLFFLPSYYLFRSFKEGNKAKESVP